MALTVKRLSAINQKVGSSNISSNPPSSSIGKTAKKTLCSSYTLSLGVALS